ncbi:MAG: hypothetical protein ACOC56_03970 [Atribacterota bacterium]
MEYHNINTDSLINPKNILNVNPYRSLNLFNFGLSGYINNFHIESQNYLRMDTIKDPYFKTEKIPQEYDLRFIPREIFLNWNYNYTYFFTVGKKIFNMSQGFVWQPINLFYDYPGYTIYATENKLIGPESYPSGFALGKIDLQLKSFNGSLFFVPERFSIEADHTLWYDTFQNNIDTSIIGVSIKTVQKGFSLKYLALTETENKNTFKYGTQINYSISDFTFYVEGAYKNGIDRFIPVKNSEEKTYMLDSQVKLIPADYKIELNNTSDENYFSDILLGSKYRPGKNWSAEFELYYNSFAWNSKEKDIYWEGIDYAVEGGKFEKELYEVDGENLPASYLKQAATYHKTKYLGEYNSNLSVTYNIKEKWDVELRLINNLQDISGNIITCLAYNGGKYWKGDLTLSLYYGEKKSQYGSSLYTGTVSSSIILEF